MLIPNNKIDDDILDIIRKINHNNKNVKNVRQRYIDIINSGSVIFSTLDFSDWINALSEIRNRSVNN